MHECCCSCSPVSPPQQTPPPLRRPHRPKPPAQTQRRTRRTPVSQQTHGSRSCWRPGRSAHPHRSDLAGHCEERPGHDRAGLPRRLWPLRADGTPRRERAGRPPLSLQDGSAWVTEAYTAAHEGELTDQSTLDDLDDLDQLEITADPATGEPRWLVYASEGKHATFASAEHCEEASIIHCLEEDCAPDRVSDKARYSILGAHALNTGEESHPLADDLAEFGMPGEHIWLDQTFCGGLGRANAADCSSGLLEKMRSDPME